MIRFHMYNRYPAYVEINYVEYDEDDPTNTLQITKQGMSSRVIDEQNVNKQFTSAEIVSSSDNFEMLPAAQASADSWKHMIPNIGDTVLRTVIERHCDLLTAAPFTHESLLIENKNERLTQEEKMLAKKSYQFEKQMNKGFGGFSNTYSKILEQHSRLVTIAPKINTYGPPVRQPGPLRPRSPPLMTHIERPLAPAPPPPYYAWNDPAYQTSRVTNEQRQNMQIAAPYLMTFKNPTNYYFGDEIVQGRNSRTETSDTRKRKREELMQRAASEKAFDFDERPVSPAWRPLPADKRWLGLGSSASNQQQVVNIMDVDSGEEFGAARDIGPGERGEIPISCVEYSGLNFGDGSSLTASKTDEQIVLLSDSD